MSKIKKANGDSIDSSIVHDYGIITETREIFLKSSSSSEDSSINHTTYERFIANLRLLESINSDPIVVHQFTIGGDWYAGMGIYDAILSSKCDFVFVCNGICASMGVITAQAALNKGVCISLPNCEWLVHEGTTCISGTYKQISSAYKEEQIALDKFYNIIVKSMKSRSERFNLQEEGKILRFIKKQLKDKEDWWISPDEAKFFGFCDGILGEEGFETIESIVKSLR
tara:strand:+ start:884 stop:1564 length:681 start_codon:yes stop_codon:yes gene_type:complete